MFFDAGNDESITVVGRLDLKDQAELIVDSDRVFVLAFALHLLEVKRTDQTQGILVVGRNDLLYASPEDIGDWFAVSAVELRIFLHLLEGLVRVAIQHPWEP
jgi:hypothetical protein